MVRIGVIDDGIVSKYLARDAVIEDYVTITELGCDKQGYGEVAIEQGASYHENESFLHGTKVINTIKKYSGEAEICFCVYDVFSGYETSSGALILEAIKMAMSRNVDMIVTCLTCNRVYEKEFLLLKEQIRNRKILFLASASNEENGGCPAELDYVLGVTGELQDSLGKYNYYHERNMQFVANTQYEFVGDLDRLQLFNGTSKATAMVAGRLTNYLYGMGIDWVQTYLSVDHIEVLQEFNSILKEFAEYNGIPLEECIKKMDMKLQWTQSNISMLEGFLYKLRIPESIYKMTNRDILTVREIVRFCIMEKQINYKMEEEQGDRY